MSTPPSTSSQNESPDSDFEIVEKPTAILYSASPEAYLTMPEDVIALASISDLENAVEHIQSMICSKEEDSEERKWLVRKLIELRLRLEIKKDLAEGSTADKNTNETQRVVLGHHFSLQKFPNSTLHYYCDRCSGVIWNISDTWYLCSDCDYRCHMKCIKHVCRVCAHVVVSEKPVYITDICPEAEDGLANQNYRCAECLNHFSFSNNLLQPRLCDYTGKYYCSTCHWNSVSVIPARVIHNWDFKERIVCRSSKQILKLMEKLPILKLEELNPVLFACIEELAVVKELRRQLLLIKKYLTSCKFALEEQLLWKSNDKLHFLENDDTYSLKDLQELRLGELIKYLKKLKDNYIQHIMMECESCRGRGYFCELCTDNKIIYPFEEDVFSCSKCQATFHLFCWNKNNQMCSKCSRIQQRLLKSESDVFNALDS